MYESRPNDYLESVGFREVLVTVPFDKSGYSILKLEPRFFEELKLLLFAIVGDLRARHRVGKSVAGYDVGGSRALRRSRAVLGSTV